MATHTTETNSVPLRDLEAAHLPDDSAATNALSRPPSYMEQDMDEPLPTYKDAVKRRFKAAQEYPAAKMPNRRARLCLVLGFSLLCIIIVAVSIAVTRININDDIDNTNSGGSKI